MILIILGIESSCDETAASIVKDGRERARSAPGDRGRYGCFARGRTGKTDVAGNA